MKKIYPVLATVCLAICIQSNVQAQFWSSMSTFVSHSTSLQADASRIKYHTFCHTTFFERYNDSTYFCSIVYPTIYTPIFTKIPMPQNLIINNFISFWTYQGFIGSYMGVGYYGHAYNYMSSVNNSMKCYTLPDVDCLTKMATFETRTVDGNRPQIKAFAIGEKAFNNTPPKSYILEFYALGVGELDPYMYAPLAYDTLTGAQEIADDVIGIKNFVIFATRDSRSGYAPVNLRISDTTSVLTNTDIDIQWRFILPVAYNVVGELNLIGLREDEFILAYVVLDELTQKYHLFTHKIKLSDFLMQVNTIETLDVIIDDVCIKWMDIAYDFDVNVMMILMSGGGKSKIYHFDPYITPSPAATILEYNNGELYDIDTITCYYSENMYIAIGGTDIFCQDISTGIDIEHSCLDKYQIKFLPAKNPKIEKKEDPIQRYSAIKEYHPYDNSAEYSYGTTTCIERNSEDDSMNQ